MVFRRITQVIVATFVGAFVILLGAPLLGQLGDHAATSSLVTSGPMSMGPLDNLAWLTLEIIPVGMPIGLIVVAIVGTVINAALARRGV
jgi:hypothetical protein